MFYKLDSTRLTMREYFRSASIFLWPILILFKLFRIRINSMSAIPDSSKPYEIDPSEIPQEVMEQIEPLEAQMIECGFVDPIYHWYCDPFSVTRTCTVNFRHVSGSTVAAICYVRSGSLKKPKESVFSSFSTPFRDGTSFVTSNRRYDLLFPPERKIQRFVGTDLPELWNLHSRQISLESFGKTPLSIHSQAEMLAFAYREEANFLEFQIQRGVLVPHTETIQKTLKTAQTTPDEAIDPKFVAVYEEIQRQINKKAGWTSMILVLLVSVVLYFTMEKNEKGWQSIALISGILVFHELGHLAAMRVFRYRNLKMFFIPFLGAAVTGQNYNVPGWKKAIVSLMGPVPGVVLGGTLGIIASINHWQTLWWAGSMLLCINLFNLLPVMPMDGGQLVHAVLFSRHPIVDALFRAIAAVLLIALGFIGGKGLMIVGITMIIGLPMTYRMGRVVQRLRKNGIDASSPDAQTVPLSVAHDIYNEILPILPANATTKISAQWTLNIFEHLNAKPPGILASLALLGVHGLSFIAGLAILIAMVIMQHGGFQNLLWSRLMSQPQCKIEAGKISIWEGAGVKPENQPAVNTLFAEFPNGKAARETYREIANKQPVGATATLFGQTVMMTLPIEDDKTRNEWFDELTKRSKNVFVQNKRLPVSFVISVSAPDVQTADKIAEEATDYFDLRSTMHPIPPWSPEQKVNERQLKARRTFQAVRLEDNLYEDPRATALNKKIDSATRRGDLRAVKMLNDQMEKIREDLRKKHIQRMRNEGEEKWDLALLDLYEKSPEPIFTGMADEAEASPDEPADTVAWVEREKRHKKWASEFSSYLGQLPMNGDSPVAGTTRFSTQYGWVQNTNQILTFNVSFERPSTGAPALIKWLSEKGCRDMKYKIESIENREEE